jgi:hypothetical protein
VKTNTKLKRIKVKPTKGRRPREEEGRSVLARRGGRKSQGRKYNFKPAVLVHFHFAADSPARGSMPFVSISPVRALFPPVASGCTRPYRGPGCTKD